MSPRRTPKRARPKTEAPTLILQGEPFKSGGGVEVGIYHVDGYGPRVIPTNRNPEGDLRTPTVKNCAHARPIRPAGSRYGGVDPGDRDGFAQVCRACAYEVSLIQSKETP